MAPRLQLQSLLEEILETGNVYFQPPNKLALSYPCIVYKRDQMDAEYADNTLYRNHTRYQVTVIDPDPDGAVRAKIAALPLCAFNRFYTSDNLNHDVFNLFFKGDPA